MTIQFLLRKHCIDWSKFISFRTRGGVKKYANILGYNYNSSEWFQQSYKVLNKDYDLSMNNSNKEKDDNF